MSASNYLETALLNLLLRNTAFSAPANVYLALFTSNPGESGSGGTEVTGNGYARKTLSTSSVFGAPSGGAVSNTAEINFGTASGGSWGPVTHWAIFDASSGGNMHWYAPVGTLTGASDITVASGQTLRIAAGALSIRVD